MKISTNSETDCIHLSFQAKGDGSTENSDFSEETLVDFKNNISVADTKFYGVYWIMTDGFLVYTAAPVTSFQLYYQAPQGAFDQVLALINSTTNGR